MASDQWEGGELALAKPKNCLQFGAEKKKRHGLRPDTHTKKKKVTTDKTTSPGKVGTLALSIERSHTNKPTP